MLCAVAGGPFFQEKAEKAFTAEHKGKELGCGVKWGSNRL